MKLGVKAEMICNKYANTVGTENELRYVIGVIQQYVGVIRLTDLLNNTLRRSEFLRIDYNKN